MKKIIILITIFSISLVTIWIVTTNKSISEYSGNSSYNSLEYSESCLTNEQINNLNTTTSLNDKIISAAKERTTHDVTYTDKYYSANSGKPPDNEGVCTDLVWRALDGADIDIQELLYEDMLSDLNYYPLHIWGMESPDKLIDFRRVPNIEAYLKKYAISLTTKIKPCDYQNLLRWQPGDIVIFSLDGSGPSDHIAIVSDSRDKDGIPKLIHNWGIGEIEDDGYGWLKKAVGHYRLK